MAKYSDNFAKDVDFCRVCLASKINLQLISDESLERSFYYFCNIIIPMKNNIWLCYLCMNNLKKCIQFQKRCQNMNKFINEYLNRLKCEKIYTNNYTDLYQSVQHNLPHSLESSAIFNVDVCCELDNSKTNVLYCHHNTDIHNDSPLCKHEHNLGGFKTEGISDDQTSMDSPEPGGTLSHCNSGQIMIETARSAQSQKIKYVTSCGEQTTTHFHEPTQQKNGCTPNQLGNASLISKCGNKLLPSSRKLKKSQQKKAPYICSQCSKTFKYNYLLVRHTACHSGVREFVCEECGKAFGTRDTLINHKLIHSTTKRFECGYCGKKYLRKFGLKIHITTHTGEKNYVCDYCGKAFSVSRNLVAHKRIHVGAKPYSCPVCHKSFTEPGTVKSHMRIHTGEKPFMCKLCDSSFRTSSELRVHEVIHSDVRPHRCDSCSFSFRRPAHLKRHQLKHTKNLKNNSLSA